MSPFESEERKIAGWLLPLPEPGAPCGPDLEYDNGFLALSVAAAGKPESTFGPAEAPDWRAVVQIADTLLGRSRDLRIAVLWLRGMLHQAGYGALPLGLSLVNGLIDSLWDSVHPLPDPDDGDPYARVNTLTALRENDGLVSDLRDALLANDRAVGTVSVRQVLVALGQLPAADSEPGPSREQLAGMLAAAAQRAPVLRQQCQDAVLQVRRLMRLADTKLGSNAAPDLRALHTLVQAVASLLPADSAGMDAAAAHGAADTAGPGAGGTSNTATTQARSLSGAVNSREDAVRAIDLVCAYLERAEPANPAPLFLRRGQQLIGRNFLQLIKALAPEALPGVAGMVGVDLLSLDESSNGLDAQR